MTSFNNSVDELRAATCDGARYDPEKFGAQCSRCYLYQHREGGPVPPEVNPSAHTVIAGEAPGEDEVKWKLPFVGKSGELLWPSFASLGFRRHDFTITNAVACRPPGNRMDELMARMKKENKELEAAGLPTWLSPIDACRPRLISELRFFRDVLALGKRAIQAITHTNASIMDMRGMPFSGVLDGAGTFHDEVYVPSPGEFVTPIRIVPTVHPAFVLRKRRWRPTFVVDLSRAMRWFSGALRWKEPQRLYQPDPDTLEYFLLRQSRPFLSYDVETDAKEPLVAKLRCVGFGDPEAVMVAGLLSIDGVTRLYDSAAEQAVKEVMSACFADRRIVKSGHNAGYYDRIVIEEQLGVTPVPLVDTILLHRGKASELPHSLAYVGSVETDVTENWKGGHVAVSAKTDFELHEYNGTDVVVQARAVQPLYNAVLAKGMLTPRDIPGLGVTNVMEIHHQLQGVCVGLHRNGLYIDQQRRREHAVKWKAAGELYRKTLRYIVGNPDFNPNSRQQLSAVLFGRFGLTPERIYADHPSAGKRIDKSYTKDGEPSTNDDVLRAAMLFLKTRNDKSSETEQALTFVETTRKFREVAKRYGTSIVPLRPCNEMVDDDGVGINLDTTEGADLVGLEWESRGDPTDGKGPRRRKAEAPHRKDKKGRILKPGLVLADGRVHPNWNSHTPTTQRFASSEPNGQNWERLIRDIVMAPMGRLLFSADQDQLELKLAAGLAKAIRYLEAFHYGLDPHGMQAELLFGSAYKHGSAEDRKKIRDFTKRFQYLMLYRGTPEKAHEVISAVENDAGELVYPDIELKEVRKKCAMWLKANPEFEAWWDADLQEYRRQGFLAEPFFGWQREFADGEDENEIANLKCQAGGAAVVHIATLKFIKHVPFGIRGPGTGLNQQGHDALMGEDLHDGKHETPYEVVKYWEGGKEKTMVVWCPEFPPETKTKDGVEIFRKKSCGCTVSQTAHQLEEDMKVDGRPFGLPVTFTAKAKVGKRWSEL